MSAVISRFDTGRKMAWSGLAPRLPRGDGVAEIVFRKTGGQTRLLHLYQRTPCRVLFPNTYRGELNTAVILTTSGGLTGGDRIRLAITVQSKAEALVTSQAAEKIYRSSGGARAIINTEIHAAAGSWLEWMPQETILFDRCRLARSTTITAHPAATVMAGDVVVFGRIAHGEVFTRGTLRDTWKVLRHGCPTWLDALVLDEAQAASLEDPAGFDGARAMATLVYVAENAITQVKTARAMLEPCTIRWGVTCVNHVLLVRFLSREPHILRTEYTRFWSAFRAAVKGLPPRVPRVWEC